jgi:hypothetical protein
MDVYLHSSATQCNTKYMGNQTCTEGSLQQKYCRLKGQKHKQDIFVAEFFVQSKPVWVGDLGSRQKIKMFMIWE